MKEEAAMKIEVTTDQEEIATVPTDETLEVMMIGEEATAEETTGIVEETTGETEVAAEVTTTDADEALNQVKVNDLLANK
jgi:hypothetical protein